MDKQRSNRHSNHTDKKTKLDRQIYNIRQTDRQSKKHRQTTMDKRTDKIRQIKIGERTDQTEISQQKAK